MRSRSFLIIFSFVALPAMGFAWNSQNTHQPLTTRSIELLSSDYKDIKVNFADRIVSGTGNSNLLLALAVEQDSHGDPTLNGGDTKYIWDRRVIENYNAFQFANAYYALGNIIHLTQDQAVPPHGANISHGMGDNFESDASGITNVIQLRGAVSGSFLTPYGYYTPALNGTWNGCENWKSIVNKEVNNNTIPTGTRFWVRNSAPGAADWGHYGGPDDTDFFDDITAGDVIRGRFDEAVTQVTGVLMAASELLPPLVRIPIKISAPVFGPNAGATITFKIIENRTPGVKISLVVDGVPIKDASGNIWDKKSEPLPFLTDSELPFEKFFSILWKGDVDGTPLADGEHTLTLLAQDSDGNDLPVMDNDGDGRVDTSVDFIPYALVFLLDNHKSFVIQSLIAKPMKFRTDRKQRTIAARAGIRLRRTPVQCLPQKRGKHLLCASRGTAVSRFAFAQRTARYTAPYARGVALRAPLARLKELFFFCPALPEKRPYRIYFVLPAKTTCPVLFTHNVATEMSAKHLNTMLRYKINSVFKRFRVKTIFFDATAKDVRGKYYV